MKLPRHCHNDVICIRSILFPTMHFFICHFCRFVYLFQVFSGTPVTPHNFRQDPPNFVYLPHSTWKRACSLLLACHYTHAFWLYVCDLTLVEQPEGRQTKVGGCHGCGQKFSGGDENLDSEQVDQICKVKDKNIKSSFSRGRAMGKGPWAKGSGRDPMIEHNLFG